MTVPGTRPQRLRRVFPEMQTNDAYTINSATELRLTALPDRAVRLSTYRGIPRVKFIGTGAENSSFQARLYGLDVLDAEPVNGSEFGDLQYDRVLLATFDATLGTLVGPSNGPAYDNTVRVADTLTVNYSPIAESYFNTVANAAPVLVSPGANGEALWGWMDAVNLAAVEWDISLDAAPSSSATGANILMMLGT